MEENINPIPQTPLPSLTNVPAPSVFKKSKFIKILAIAELVFTVPQLLGILFSFSSFSMNLASAFDDPIYLLPLLSFIVPIAALLVIFTKNKKIYKISKIIVIAWLFVPIFAFGLLFFWISPLGGSMSF